MRTLDLNSGSTVKVDRMTATHVPNHHGHFPRFAGLNGLLAALSMTVGRSGDARLAAELTELSRGDLVVDIGCGPGAAARHAARAGATVTGVDPAAVMRRVAGVLSLVTPRVRYLDGAAEALPLPDDSATVVWSLATVHHWPDLDAGLREVRRVLRPGGRFLAVERRTEPAARGLASHGWTDHQAEAFAGECSDHGFVDVRIDHHTTDRRNLVSVVASR